MHTHTHTHMHTCTHTFTHTRTHTNTHVHTHTHTHTHFSVSFKRVAVAMHILGLWHALFLVAFLRSLWLTTAEKILKTGSSSHWSEHPSWMLLVCQQEHCGRMKHWQYFYDRAHYIPGSFQTPSWLLMVDVHQQASALFSQGLVEAWMSMG